MEPDLALEIAKQISARPDAVLSQFVSDGDSSAFANIRAEVTSTLEKVEDRNHVVKNFGKELYTMKPNHKQLSEKVIQYLQTQFAYLTRQNQGDKDGMVNALEALKGHPFDQHSQCGDWCKHASPSHTSMFKSLPRGKPLSDPLLRQALADMLDRYKQKAGKLANMCSTQANESMNAVIASKAPKRQHLSSSGSLTARVAAAVLQKNEGYGYLSEVCERLGLPPARRLRDRAQLLDVKAAKRGAKQKTRACKRRRLTLKKERKTGAAACEIREGETYASSMAFEKDVLDISAIPPPLPRVEKTVSAPREMLKADVRVVFDLETTGLGRDAHITQVAAVRGEQEFSAYVLPMKDITPGAAATTGMAMREGQLFVRGVPVLTLTIKQALLTFFLFCGTDAVLIGHNCHRFDCNVLQTAVLATGLQEECQKSISGFVDSLAVCRRVFPGRASYKQSDLYTAYVEEVPYPAHDALEDARSLQRILAVPAIEVGLSSNETVILSAAHLMNSALSAPLPSPEQSTGQKSGRKRPISSPFAARKNSRWRRCGC